MGLVDLCREQGPAMSSLMYGHFTVIPLENEKERLMQNRVFFSLFLPVIQCPALTTPDHTIQAGYGCTGVSSNYSTSCFFSCMMGYETVGGSQKRTCLETRQWSGTELQCQGNGE